MIEHVRRELQVSERRACAALGQHRSTQRKAPHGRDDEQRLTADIVELARQYGRYGYGPPAGALSLSGSACSEFHVETGANDVEGIVELPLPLAGFGGTSRTVWSPRST